MGELALIPNRQIAEDLTFEQVREIAKELVPTGFLPEHIKTPGQAMAIILTGRELGMGPMRSLRSFSMVKGKVVESADSQLARFKEAGGRAQFQELSETRAVLKLRHPNGDEHIETFTLEDAKRAGLLQSQPNYQRHPKAMLRSRSITAGLKSVGWSGSVGAYDPDEAREFGTDPTPARVEPLRPAASAAVTAEVVPPTDGSARDEPTSETGTSHEADFVSGFEACSTWDERDELLKSVRKHYNGQGVPQAVLNAHAESGRRLRASGQ